LEYLSPRMRPVFSLLVCDEKKIFTLNHLKLIDGSVKRDYTTQQL
jgi:hypothetical protein